MFNLFDTKIQISIRMPSFVGAAEISRARFGSAEFGIARNELKFDKSFTAKPALQRLSH